MAGAVAHPPIGERPLQTIDAVRLGLSTPVLAAAAPVLSLVILAVVVAAFRPLAPFAFGSASMASLLTAYLLNARAEALGDARLRWAAIGYAAAALGLFLQTFGLVEATEEAGAGDRAALLWLLWHAVLVTSIGGAVRVPRAPVWLRGAPAVAAGVAMLYTGWAGSDLPTVVAGGRQTAPFRLAIVLLALAALGTTAGWIRSPSVTSGWTARWVAVGLGLGTLDLAIAAAVGTVGPESWANVSLGLIQFVLVASGLLVGFIAHARAVAHQERGLTAMVEEDPAPAPPDTDRRRRIEDHRLGEMRRAVVEVLDGEALTMVFQPVVNLWDGSVAGVEALSRFESPPYRPPDHWFGDAWAVGLGEPLELKAVEMALARFPEVPEDAYLSLNVSASVAASEAFRHLLAGHEPGRLVIELTEHDRVADYEALNAALREMRDAGVRVAVDDAGAGFASMRHIVCLAPDFIKLDVSLTRNINTDRVRRALAASLIVFAGDIGATIIAEGIETWREIETLRALGVTFGQGYHLGWPSTLPLSDMVRRRMLQAV